jgi:hypothetical protein
MARDSRLIFQSDWLLAAAADMQTNQRFANQTQRQRTCQQTAVIHGRVLPASHWINEPPQVIHDAI